MSIFKTYQNEQEYADFDKDMAIRHLSNAIQIKTVSHLDAAQTDWSAFSRFHNCLYQWYPTLLKTAEFKEIGMSLLIRIPGSDSSLKPGLLMAHQDVVDVVKGTEKDWTHPPFKGEIADEYIWGRGAIDIKNMLIAELESVEYLLNQGFEFKRTLYLAFGHDEETSSTGARAVADYLQSQNVELEFVLDEGGYVTDGKVYGADGINVVNIGTYEKGYADLKLVARSKGGHSSNPFDGTSLGQLAKAITAIIDNPLENQLPAAARETLRVLTPYIKEGPLKELVTDINGHAEEITDYYLSKRELNSQVHTTIAPTMITQGAPSGNVMPQDMEAVINFRLAPQDSKEELLEHCCKLAKDVEVSYVGANEASRQSRFDKEPFKKLTEVLSHYFTDTVFVPSVNTTATDARSYEKICDCCLRFGPFLEEEAIRRQGMHGTDERISIRAYLQGIRVLISFIKEMF